MSKDYPKCESQVQITTEKLSEILQLVNVGDNAHGFSTPFLVGDAPWLLWVEPIARTGHQRCTSVFSGKGADDSQSLTEVLESGWEFSEFFWFTPGTTLHGIKTEQNTLLKQVKAIDSPKGNDSRTPYLRQDMNRFDQELTFIDHLKNQPLIKENRLVFLEYKTQWHLNCECNQSIEYIIKEGV